MLTDIFEITNQGLTFTYLLYKLIIHIYIYIVVICYLMLSFPDSFLLA